MPRLQRKNFATPDEIRTFASGRVDIIRLDEIGIGRCTLQPGWRWSKDVAPVVRTRSCQDRHLGDAISGSIRVTMDDGTEMVIAAGDGYEIPPGHEVEVIGHDRFESVEFASGHTFGLAPEELGERLLATILFSDIVDSTAMLERLGDHAWADLLERHNVTIRSAIDQYRGREMATLGDGFLAIFDGPARAVRAAAMMDEMVKALNLRLRIGIHTGEVEIVGGQARGVAVHTAARVASLAKAGEVLISATTHDLLEGSGLHFDDHGLHELKGLRGQRAIFLMK